MGGRTLLNQRSFSSFIGLLGLPRLHLHLGLLSTPCVSFLVSPSCVPPWQREQERLLGQAAAGAPVASDRIVSRNVGASGEAPVSQDPARTQDAQQHALCTTLAPLPHRRRRKEYLAAFCKASINPFASRISTLIIREVAGVFTRNLNAVPAITRNLKSPVDAVPAARPPCQSGNLAANRSINS